MRVCVCVCVNTKSCNFDMWWQNCSSTIYELDEQTKESEKNYLKYSDSSILIFVEEL